MKVTKMSQQDAQAALGLGEPTSDTGIIPDSNVLTRRGLLWRVIDVMLAMGIAGMLVALMVQVVGRLLSASPVWTEELARFLFLFTVVMGMAAGFRLAAHPRMAFLVTRGPGWLRHLSVHLTVACAVFVFAFLAWTAYELMMQQIRTNETSPALAIGMWVMTLPMVVSSLLSILAVVQSHYLDTRLRGRVLNGEVIA